MYGGEMQPSFLAKNNTQSLTGVDQLLAIEAIKRTKAFYCFYLDTDNWDGYQNLFTDDAIMELPPHGSEPAARIEGAIAIREHVEAAVKGAITTHQCHTPIIDFTSTTTANVIWAMEDMLRFPEDAPIDELHGMGHYFEKYRRIDDGRWSICHLLLTRLRLDLT